MEDPMMPRSLRLLMIILCVCAVEAGESPALPPVGIVSRVKVVSNRVADVSSLAAWKASFIKDGMSDEQKAIAIFDSVVGFLHHAHPAKEYLLGEQPCVHDPIKAFNVYGYGFCCCTAGFMEALARSIGMEARGWSGPGHQYPELRFADGWHMLDPAFINYFPDANGRIADVAALLEGVAKWSAANPGYLGEDAKLRQFMKKGGWKKGPEVLATCPFFDDNGWLPEAGHGWYSMMYQFGNPAKTFQLDVGYALGYEVNNQLRRGERLTFKWSNEGLYLGKEEGDKNNTITESPGKGGMKYAPKYGDLTQGRVGNGVREYEVPLADGGFRSAALVADNLATRGEDSSSPALHAKSANAPATLVLRMPSSYVYLDGQLYLDAVVGAGGSIAISISDNNGLDWKDAAPPITASAAGLTIDLKPMVYRRYDYRVKLVFSGAGTGVDALRLANRFQHSQRALPSLDQGANAIRFSSGSEGTITVEGSTNTKSASGKQVLFSDLHAQLDGVAEPFLSVTGARGDVTIPIQTPGDMKRLRVGYNYRARGQDDGWEIGVSFDGGATYCPVDEAKGPVKGMSAYASIDAPPGCRTASLRFHGHGNGVMLFATRIDADYTEPTGGFAPLKVTYAWDENGTAKRDEHVASKADESYEIHCDGKPTMKSLVLEFAP
jgi:hypothetical protein